MTTPGATERSVSLAYDRGTHAYCRAWAYPHPWLKEQRDRFIAMLRSGAQILDVGCGPGSDSAFFREKGFETVGVDVSREMIRCARLHHPECRFEVLSALHIEELSVLFDAIWLSYVVLHIERGDLAHVVKATFDSLKENGLLFFVTSVDVETIEEKAPIAGLKDADGADILVYTVRWQVDELRNCFSGYFDELWSTTDVPLPNKRRSFSSIWRRK